MPRAARVVFSSMSYHIISRGNNREPVFDIAEQYENSPNPVMSTRKQAGSPGILQDLT